MIDIDTILHINEKIDIIIYEHTIDSSKHIESINLNYDTLSLDIETSIVSTKQIEYRSVLSQANNGKIVFAEELKGIGAKSGLLYGVLLLSIELYPKHIKGHKLLKEKVILDHLHAEKEKEEKRIRT